MDLNRPRNVLFLIADDWSRIAGVYDNAAIQTPNIDSLAATGVVFDWSFCTSPSCAVSRACILTGQHSHTHGQYGHCHGFQGFSTHTHMGSTPQSLKAAGYVTACIGKKHVAPESVYPFDYEPEVDMRNGIDLASKARHFLHQNSTNPFYLHVGFTDPHRSSKGFGNECSYAGVPEVYYDPDQVLVPEFLPDVAATRVDLADYYQAVTRFDFNVGQVLGALQESGRADDTLVILTTDHAMPFPGAKASFFESGHHCPFIICTPDQAYKDTHHQALINWLDIRPTIHDWCGLDIPAELPGRSLLPILGAPNVAGWDEVVYSHCFHEVIDYNPYRVLRGRRYKYVQNLAADLTPPLPTDLFRSKTWTAVQQDRLTQMGLRQTAQVVKREAEELYDLVEDPLETHNCISAPQLQDLVKAMRQRLYDFRRQTHDPWLEVDFQAGRIDAAAVAR